MHEVGLAAEIIRTVEAHVASGDLGRVESIHVEVGELSGVTPEALELGFEVARADTPLAGARLVIEQVPSAIPVSVCSVTLSEDGS